MIKFIRRGHFVVTSKAEPQVVLKRLGNRGAGVRDLKTRRQGGDAAIRMGHAVCVASDDRRLNWRVLSGLAATPPPYAVRRFFSRRARVTRFRFVRDAGFGYKGRPIDDLRY